MEPKEVALQMQLRAGDKMKVSRGFTLIEVLVTVVIVSVSLLGLVSLDGVSKLSSYEARQRSNAILAANDFVERLRLNKSAWIANKLASSSTTYTSNITESSSISLPSCASSDGSITTSTCSTANIVQLDLYNLKLGLFPSTSSQQMIQNAAACVYLSRPSSSSLFEATIVISWQDRQALTDAATTNVENSSTSVSSLINNCGTSGDNRRQYLIKTVI